MAETWDAIVIGSGIGGMCAAGFLAKVGKMKVLVLEKHSERGGMTHTFRRDGASWDVGVHYVGDLEKGSTIRRIFDFLSDDALEWNRMPDEFERFVYPGLDFAVPSNPKLYQERLSARFPGEAAAIRRYFVDLRKASGWSAVNMFQPVAPSLMALPMGFWRQRGLAKMTMTTAEYLDQHFKSAELKALLTSQWGDYGLPPKESPFALHALVAWSYANGGWFPKGGSSRIARTFEVGIEAHGGLIKVCHEVTSIMTSKEGRVTGVKAVNLSSASPSEIVYKAPIVISNAGAPITYKRLLPIDGEIGRRTSAVRELIDRLREGTSAVTLYLRLSKPPSSIGVKGENFWINTTYEHISVGELTTAALAGKPPFAFMSFPSAKSGDDRFHTAEIITLVDGNAFSAWKKTELGQRGSDYLELKDRISQGLIDLAETVTPGLKDIISYAELSTPLSVEHYTSHPTGAIYGLRGTPEKYRSSALTSASPIPGLYLSGTDVATLGVAGALMGGVVAASRVLGPMGLYRVFSASYRQAKSTTSGSKTALRSPDKKRAVVIDKKALTSLIWKIEFELDEPVTYVPGQFAMLLVAPFEWRSYSIASVEGRHLTLLISTRTGGDGSIFIQNVKPGSETQIELPFGAFQLRQNTNRKVFIATGTGLAPFLPMFAAMQAAGQLDSAELLFGCRQAEENITQALPPLPRTTVCVSREPSANGVFHGRVTQALEKMDFNPSATDFYLCGAPAMINDCRAMLSRAGASNIYTESY